MADFNWQTDDDGDWDDFEPKSKPPRTRKALPKLSPRLWLPVVAAAAIVVIAGYFLRGRVEQTIDQEVSATETQVIASVDLIFQKSADRDIELFGTLLSGRDPEWSVTQQQMVGNNGLLDRSMFRWQTAEQLPETSLVELSPNLLSAEITVTTKYTLPNSSTTATFELPTVFRKGKNHWLFSPPDPEFWGATVVNDTGTIQITHPERDAEIVNKLRIDLDKLYFSLCETESGLNCSTKVDTPVIFSETATSLANLRLQPAPRLTDAVILPTPSLVGLPVDTTAYRTLLSGYADQIFSVLLADNARYKCCDQALYFRAIVDQQLQKIGLWDGAVSAETTRNLLDRGVSLNHTPSIGWDINDLRAAQPQPRDFATTFVDFILTTNPSLRPSDLQRALASNSGDFDDWLKLLADAAPSGQTIGTEWLYELGLEPAGRAYSRYLNGLLSESSALPPQPLPQPLPDAKAVVACKGPDNQSVVATYDFATEDWEEIYSSVVGRLPYDVKLRVMSLPEHQGVWIQPLDRRKDLADWDHTPRLWRDGELQPITINGLFYWMWHGSADNTLVLYQVQPRAINGTESVTNYVSLDLNSCSAESCEFDNHPGNPHWSPDGSYTVYDDNEDGTALTLLQSDGTFVESLDAAETGLLSWLNSDTNLWLESSKIVRKTIGQAPVDWITIEDLAPVLPVESADRYNIVYFVLNPSDANELIILVSEKEREYLSTTLVYNVETGAVERYQPLPNAALYSLADNGIYSAFTLPSDDTGNWSRYELVLHNRETQQTDHYAFGPTDRFTWVDEVNNWGLVLNNDVLRLISPEHDYSDVILPPYQECNSVTWVHNP